MSVEYHFFPCKNKRIIGGFVRDENGEFDYESVFWGKSNIHWDDLKRYAIKLSLEDIDPMDFDFLTYDCEVFSFKENGSEDLTSKKMVNAYYISKYDIEDHASESLMRGFMTVEDAFLFAENDFDENLIYDGIIHFISSNEYMAQAPILNVSDYTTVSFIDYDRFEYTCFQLNNIIWNYPDADGVIVKIC